MKRPLTGRGVLLWLITFFGVIIAVDGYFIAASVSTFRGEDEQKPYLQGIGYNTTLTRRAVQQRNGWTAHITLDRLSSGAARVDILLMDAAGHPKDVGSLGGELRHPSDETRDQPLRFEPRSAGRYEARVMGAGRGAWDVVITSDSASVPFEASRRLWLP